MFTFVKASRSWIPDFSAESADSHGKSHLKIVQPVISCLPGRWLNSTTFRYIINYLYYTLKFIS